MLFKKYAMGQSIKTVKYDDSSTDVWIQYFWKAFDNVQIEWKDLQWHLKI